MLVNGRGEGSQEPMAMTCTAVLGDGEPFAKAVWVLAVAHDVPSAGHGAVTAPPGFGN
jgi:hypothetical protein